MSTDGEARRLEWVVDAENSGRRLDAVVGAHEAVDSRAEAQRLIEAERVWVDGDVRPKRYPVEAGAVIVVRMRPAALSELVPDATVPFEIRYQDEHLLVVDKPAGVVTHPAAGNWDGTLVHGLLAHAVRGGDDPTRPGIVHRLDRDTSGLLVVARSERAHRRLQRMMRRREIERHYRVLAHGQAPPALTIDRPIGRDRRVRTRMAVDVTDGRDAITHLRLLEALGALSLLEARLETGRTHQIRVHLEAVGHPVAGDTVYGRRPQSLGLERQFLHAARLSFPHPETEAQIVVESPLPADLESALAVARERMGPDVTPHARPSWSRIP